MRRLLCVAMVGALAPMVASAQTHFERDVAPILRQHCLRCHQPGNAKGDISLATAKDLREGGHVVPGKPADSSVLALVSGEDGKKPRMPRQGPALTAAQVDVLRRWIAGGAEWPDTVVLREAARADASWWSLQPIGSPTPPASMQFSQGWDKNPIDRFVHAKLTEKGLLPNPPADRPTLIRRLSYDLLGLPPTPEEIKAFVDDDSPSAYEALVDRLLASPHYGEHWGRHWLDVVRFGESNGYERNILLPNLWPFRDYVIAAFNDDRPFDQLVREHLAGDLVGKEDPRREIGTAFLVCGPYDNVGNSDAVQAAIIRANHLDEIARAVSETFLGLTIGCARCHDHKFDPIRQEDYYAFTATFAGVKHGERKITDSNGDSTTVWAGLFDAAGASKPHHLLIGGDPQKKGPVVGPASLSATSKLASHYVAPPTASEPERRLALAEWLVAADHPLTARVLANRIWHYHFGTGIVDTPSDFGWMGGRPSHPELLDWLARQLMEGGWKLKPLHRLIVTSRTYQQSSRWRDAAAAVDGESRLLWRFPPRRLTGEEIRDSMLLFAGKLKADEGGPGFQLYKYVQDNVATYHPLDKHGSETYRRSVYHQNARAARVDLLSDFDCPDPAAAAPRRPATTSPLQALALMNHSFTHDMAGFLAELLCSETGDRAAAQVRRAFAIVYGREPADDELERALLLVESRGLPALCLALLNSNEAVFLR